MRAAHTLVFKLLGGAIMMHTLHRWGESDSHAKCYSKHGFTTRTFLL